MDVNHKVHQIVEAHRRIRAKMTAAHYPNLEDEGTTVELVLRGIIKDANTRNCYAQPNMQVLTYLLIIYIVASKKSTNLTRSTIHQPNGEQIRTTTPEE